MANIKWIKLSADIFDNRKIRYLRQLPNGNNIVLIWIMLLTMAGRCNADGAIFLTEKIPYSEKMLADELGFDEATIRSSLSIFQNLDMVHMTDGAFLCVNGWAEHQNVEGMERIREQTKARVARCRKNKKDFEGAVSKGGSPK